MHVVNYIVFIEIVTTSTIEKKSILLGINLQERKSPRVMEDNPANTGQRDGGASDNGVEGISTNDLRSQVCS